MRSDDMPSRYRQLYQRAMSGKSLKSAVRAHCLMCTGWQAREVRACTAPTCPLYVHRLSARQAAADRRDGDEAGSEDSVRAP